MSIPHFPRKHIKPVASGLSLTEQFPNGAAVLTYLDPETLEQIQIGNGTDGELEVVEPKGYVVASGIKLSVLSGGEVQLNEVKYNRDQPEQGTLPEQGILRSSLLGSPLLLWRVDGQTVNLSQTRGGTLRIGNHSIEWEWLLPKFPVSPHPDHTLNTYYLLASLKGTKHEHP